MQDTGDILGTKEKCSVCKLCGHFLYKSHLFDFGDIKRCTTRKCKSCSLNNYRNVDKKA